jgi:hypothetical protein
MESTSEPGRIHCSSKTRELLETTGKYVFTSRGEIDVKGKGLMETSWLESSLYMSASPGQADLASVLDKARSLLNSCPVERSYDSLFPKTKRLSMSAQSSSFGSFINDSTLDESSQQRGENSYSYTEKAIDEVSRSFRRSSKIAYDALQSNSLMLAANSTERS